MIKSATNDAGAFNKQGINLDNLGKYEEAIEHYKKAIALKPDCATYYHNLGLSYNNWKKFDQAIECFQKAITLKPDYASCYNQMGESYCYLEKYPHALESFEKAVELKSDDAVVYYNLGNTLHSSGKYQEAIESYNKANSLVANKPTHSIFFICARARTYKTMGLDKLSFYDFNEAASLAQKCKHEQDFPALDFFKVILPEVYTLRENFDALVKKEKTFEDGFKQAYYGFKDEFISVLTSILIILRENETKLFRTNQSETEKLAKIKQENLQLRHNMLMLQKQIIIILRSVKKGNFDFDVIDKCLKENNHLARELHTLYNIEVNSPGQPKTQSNGIYKEDRFLYQSKIIQNLLDGKKLNVDNLRKHLIGYYILTPAQITILEMDLRIIIDDIRKHGLSSHQSKVSIEILTEKAKAYGLQNINASGYNIS